MNVIKLYNRGSRPYFVRFYNTKTGVKKSFYVEPNIYHYRIVNEGYNMCECLDECRNPVNVYWNDESQLRSFIRIKNPVIHIEDQGQVVTPWTFEYY